MDDKAILDAFLDWVHNGANLEKITYSEYFAGLGFYAGVKWAESQLEPKD